jgi:hypothetical protein
MHTTTTPIKISLVCPNPLMLIHHNGFK